MKSLARSVGAGALVAVSSVLLFACGGSSSGSTGLAGAGGAFYVIDTVPKNNGTVFLNQTIALEFTQEVDLTSVDLNSWSFVARDPGTGNPLGEAVVGEFRYQVTEGVTNRRVVEFLPTFPSNNLYDNGGFKPGRRYDVELNAGSLRGAPALRSLGGQLLNRGAAFVFFTPEGTTPQQLFIDIRSGGPNRVALSPEGTTEDLNFFIAPNDPIRLVFNQPLNPASSNFNTERIFLEYFDPDASFGTPPNMTRIPAVLELVTNLPTRAEATLTPVGVLPSFAEIFVIVEAALEDIAGESNVADPAFKRVFGSFKTVAAFPFQYDAIVESFDDHERFDAEAAFMEPLADWKEGRLRASFDYGGTMTLFDFEPTQREVVLNTDFTQVIPKQGVPFTVSGGVFQFNDITIPSGVVVRGEGSNPLVLLAAGKVLIDGTLSVNGADGTIVDTLRGAENPVPGGAGVCGGGRGGAGSPQTLDSSPKGADGTGPGNLLGQGGRGGHSGFGTSQVQGAGGGGGSFSTYGDNGVVTNPTAIEDGKGGDGKGTDAILGEGDPQGGMPGALAFTDKDATNDFFGRDVRTIGGRLTAVLGELKAPIGGQGGGGGGDRVVGSFPSGPAYYNNNEKGGGGGGGGGILIVKAIGSITVSQTGRISADGGHGGGGEVSGGCTSGGGGAGGSGGTIILQSSTRIDLKNKVSGYSVTADGGIGSNGIGKNGFWSKYEAAVKKAPTRGGYGGLGLVQLMAPNPTTDISFTANQVKPAPVRLPATFGYLSRARSKWLYVGAAQRQTTSNQFPRFLDNAGEPGKFGPEYRFAGIHASGTQAGYVDYRTEVNQGIGSGRVFFPELHAGVATRAVPAGGGSSFHVVEDLNLSLGATNNLRGTSLQIVDQGAVTAEWLVAGNTERQLFLAPASGPAFSAALLGKSFKVVGKYFDLWTGQAPGLALLVENNQATPSVNVRIGFAACSGFDANGDPLNRYPASGFAYDLQTEAGREAFWKIGASGYRARPYVLFDVLFNLSYNPDNPAVPKSTQGVNPETPLPELRHLVVPFRF